MNADETRAASLNRWRSSLPPAKIPSLHQSGSVSNGNEAVAAMIFRRRVNRGADPLEKRRVTRQTEIQRPATPACPSLVQNTHSTRIRINLWSQPRQLNILTSAGGDFSPPQPEELVPPPRRHLPGRFKKPPELGAKWPTKIGERSCGGGDEGLCKSTGWSDLTLEKFQEIIAVARIKPAAGQVESHPYLPGCMPGGHRMTSFSSSLDEAMAREVDGDGVGHLAALPARRRVSDAELVLGHRGSEIAVIIIVRIVDR